MYKATDIAKAFEVIAPKETGVANDELGFVFGDPETEVTGLACLWDINTESIKRCIEKPVNMIICHECIWLPDQASDWYQGPAMKDVFSNCMRKQLLDQHGMVVYRSHSNWDALPQDGVPDQALLTLGIEGLRATAGQKFFSVQELPQEMSVDTLTEHIKSGLKYESCRIFGDKKKRIRKFAFLVGGFGENQHHMPQVARDMGAEAIVIGEMSEFIVIACLEMGMPVIETLHSASEIPAIKRQATMLSQTFPDLPVHYIPSGARAFSQERQGV